MCLLVFSHQASEESGTKGQPDKKHQSNDDDSGEPAAKRPHGKVYLG